MKEQKRKTIIIIKDKYEAGSRNAFDVILTNKRVWDDEVTMHNLRWDNSRNLLVSYSLLLLLLSLSFSFSRGNYYTN